MKGKVNSGNFLIIFVRNQELGKVKTRLAKTVGESNALKIYTELLQKTSDIAVKVQCFRVVYYSNWVDFNDMFNPTYFYKDEQVGEGLGERMKNAFENSFEEGASKVVCIGSDCYDLTTEIIEQAFKQLDDSDVVFGPAEDGGYYLIGMKTLITELFEDKEWGNSDVLLDSILSVKQLNKQHNLLQTLNDVDEEKDLPEELRSLI